VFESTTARSAAPSVWELPPEEQARAAAASLSDALATGWRPPAAPALIALNPGEVTYASTTFHASSFTGAAVSYNKGFMVGLGNPVVLAATLGGSLLYNQHQKTKAQRTAAPQWRPLDGGVLHLTSERFGLQGRLRWAEIPYPAVRASDCVPQGIVLFLDGEPPLLVATPWPEYFFVMFRWLAYQQIVPFEVAPKQRPLETQLGPGSLGN
jgi:hypothetical protein